MSDNDEVILVSKLPKIVLEHKEKQSAMENRNGKLRLKISTKNRSKRQMKYHKTADTKKGEIDAKSLIASCVFHFSTIFIKPILAWQMSNLFWTRQLITDLNYLSK